LFRLTFASSVLHLRGNSLIKQPLIDKYKNILLWNGEIYYRAGQDDTPKSENDAEALLKLLSKCNNKDAILTLISSIRGPFSFIYWVDKAKKLWLGRDILGRRSLCWAWNSEHYVFTISSIALANNISASWEEVSNHGIYCIDLTNDKVSKENIELYQWSTDLAGNELNSDTLLKSPIVCQLNRCLPCKKGFEISDSVVKEFIAILENAVKIRLETFNHICSNCYLSQEFEKKPHCTHAYVSICFSGGLDSTLLALITDKFVPIQNPIDLLNVAFGTDAPDRLTGLESLKELKKLRPLRKWNLVKIDVNFEELCKFRAHHIKHLIHPLTTVLDDSIGCALWFTSRGKGTLEANESLYISPSRVILLGLGIDEQLSGYSRHRRVFQEKSWIGLVDEISMELKRISERNLGRDDRVISDHSREARLPYLDENVINYLNSLPIWMKVNLNLERGKGEKLLLRLVGQKLSLINASTYKKRAIQFGSRIAKLESKQEKGSDPCPRLSKE